MPQMSFDIECVVCNLTFKPRSHNAKFCSSDCKEVARKVRYFSSRSNRKNLFNLFNDTDELNEMDFEDIFPPLGGWIDSAMCGGDTSDVWVTYDPDHTDVLRALQVCARCPVTGPCYDEAVSFAFDGIWGGRVMAEGVPTHRLHSSAQSVVSA